MIAALYCRVSSAEQVDNFSISAQLTQLTEYCKKNSIHIYNTYIDEGISGTKENRPQFQKMIKDSENKLFNIILVHKYDRFARKVELSQKIKNKLKQNNINVISITEPIENSPMGFFVSGLHDLLAEYYIHKLSEEAKKGQLERARQGYHNGGIMAYGYDFDKATGNMIVNPEKAKIVKWIYDMYNNQGYGEYKIATILNEHNIPAPVNGIWTNIKISRILKNVKNIGKIMYKNQTYNGKHEPIISEEEFNIANSILENKHLHKTSNNAKFLLFSMIKCGDCGRAMTIFYSNKQRANSYVYYSCYSSKTNFKTCTHKKYYRTNDIHDAIIDKLNTVMKGYIHGITVKTKTNVSEILEGRVSKIETELERAKKAYLQSVFTLEEYTEVKNKLLSEKESLIKNLKNNSEQNNYTLLQTKIEDTLQKFNTESDIIKQRNILKQIIEKILIHSDNSIEIIFNI